MEPIKVLYVDEKGKTVIFLDQDQYVFNTFKVDEGKYKYTTDGEDGWTFSADNGIPFLLRTVNTKNAGNVIWGALITNEKIKKIEVIYKYNKDVQVTWGALITNEKIKKLR